MCLVYTIRRRQFVKRNPLIKYKGDPNKIVCYKVVRIDSRGNIKPAHIRNGKKFIAKKWLDEKDFRIYDENMIDSSNGCMYRSGFHLLLSVNSCREYIDQVGIYSSGVRIIKCIVHKDKIVSQGNQSNNVYIPCIISKDMYIPKQYMLNAEGQKTKRQVKSR